MKNIRTLPRGKSSRLYFDVVTKKLLLQERLSLNATSFPIEKRNIYITSNEKIKIGDWFITADLLWKANQNIHLINPKRDKKIILTTDQDLIKDGVQAIDDEFLNWFVKNPSCEVVEVVKTSPIRPFGSLYIIIIPKEKVLLQSSIDGEVIWGELKEEILEEAKQMMVTQEYILEQIALTEARGEKIVKYLNRYKGDSIYNEIALAIEFGYQLKLEEDEK